MAQSALFSPLRVGRCYLGNRVVLAPLTRTRATEEYDPYMHAAEYYSQRAAIPGTLLITEATFISEMMGGYKNIPGIWNQSQIQKWKKITDAVHEKGSFIYLQLWALGRVASREVLESRGFKLQGAGNIPLDPNTPQENKPVPLTEEQINQVVEEYTNAAVNAVEKAGFDGVEIHGANGYLIDQFIQDVTNNRTDKYGGTVENRSRFAIQVVESVCSAIGPDRTAIRLSPWSPFQNMGMKDPVPQFTHLISELSRFNMAYLSLVVSRETPPSTMGSPMERDDLTETEIEVKSEPIGPFVNALSKECSTPVLLASGFKRDNAFQTIDQIAPLPAEKGGYAGRPILIGFGRLFLSTPDIVFRLKHGLPFNQYRRKTFYGGDTTGYTDYPFSKEYEEALANGEISKDN